MKAVDVCVFFLSPRTTHSATFQSSSTSSSSSTSTSATWTHERCQQQTKATANLNSIEMFAKQHRRKKNFFVPCWRPPTGSTIGHICNTSSNAPFRHTHTHIRSNGKIICIVEKQLANSLKMQYPLLDARIIVSEFRVARFGSMRLFWGWSNKENDILRWLLSELIWNLSGNIVEISQKIHSHWRNCFAVPMPMLIWLRRDTQRIDAKDFRVSIDIFITTAWVPNTEILGSTKENMGKGETHTNCEELRENLSAASQSVVFLGG